MPDQLVEALISVRDGYEEEAQWHRFLLDAYSGCGGFEGKIRQPDTSFWGPAASAYALNSTLPVDQSLSLNTYLDQYPREDASKFKRRVQLAHYVNYVRKLTDVKLSYLMRKPPDRKVPTKTEQWMEDVRGDGTTYESTVAAVAVRTAVLGWSFSLVDAPRRQENLSAAQAEAADVESGERVRVIHGFPANLLAYNIDKNGQFVWAKVRFDYCEQDTFLSKERHTALIQVWTRTDVTECLLAEDKDGALQLVAPPQVIPHDFKTVPIVIHRHTRVPDDDVKGIPMSSDVAVENRRLFNLNSELDEHLRSQVFAFLQVPTKNPNAVAGLIVGTENALAIPIDSSRDYMYVAPPPSVAATYEKRIEETIRVIYEISRCEFARATTGQAVAAASRAYEFAETNRALADFAREMALSEERVLRLVATALGEDGDDITVQPQSRFDVEEMAVEIQQSLDAISMGLGKTAEEKIKLRIAQLMLPGLNPEELATVRSELSKLSEEEQAMKHAQEQLDQSMLDTNQEPTDEPQKPPVAPSKK